jgi:hypothetical protein
MVDNRTIMFSMPAVFNPWFPIGAWGSAVSNEYSYPTITLKRYSSSHSIEKVENRMWTVKHLSFDDLISLQNADIKYTFTRVDNDVFMTFETEADEAQAIMLLGT